MASSDSDDDSASSSLGDDPSYHLLQRVKSMQHKAYKEKNPSEAAKYYRAAIKELDDNKGIVVDSSFLDGLDDVLVTSLRVDLNSSLADAYLQLGLCFLAQKHYQAALDIDGEHQKNVERLKNVEEDIANYNETVGRFEEKLAELEEAKSSKDMRKMMNISQELADTRDGGKNDAEMVCRSLLVQADSELVLAQALLNDTSCASSYVARVSAVAHLSRSSELCQEVLHRCSEYKVDSHGYNSSDQSEGAAHSYWQVCLRSAEAWVVLGQVLMIEQMEKLFLVPSKVDKWDAEDRQVLYLTLDAAIMHFRSGIDELELLGDDAALPMNLRAFRTRVEVECYSELMAIEVIGENIAKAAEYASTLSQVTHNYVNAAVSTQDVRQICSKIQAAYFGLGSRSVRSSAKVWPIAQVLLYCLAKAWNVAGVAEKEVNVYRGLIRARRKSWAVHGVIADVSPPTTEEAWVDADDMQCLIAALRKTGLEVGDDCPICMEALSSGGVVQILDCRHLFHQNCCKRYFKAMVTHYDIQRAQSGEVVTRSMPCPTCRTEQSFKISPFGDVLDE